ncbi:MAG TPA: PLP-dependent aminotransferase family protein [Propionicimonas sp.]|uniref:MocR-like transcription factor YczR n=1 Tax=Propionicimonas sp. TaxID=1955623 RepID=UPI002F40A211
MDIDHWRALLPLPEELPGYLAVARGIRGMAMDGRLGAGARLPSERTLALALGVSRTTITRAYGELVASGWARARQGSGTTVILPTGERAPSFPLIPGLRTDAIDLSAAAGLAPSGTAAIIRGALEWLPSTLNSAGYEPFGAPHLRRRIADWYGGRGLATDPDQIVVTAGAMTAVSVAMHSLLGPGERIVVDSPTYPGALGAIEAVRARAVSVPLVTGWDVAGWEEALRRSKAGAAYLIPDFHNPTGLLMPGGQRVELAGLLARHDCVPIIDETLVELNLSGLHLPAPFAVADGRAITIGSLSKVLWGGIRIGWLRCPPARLDAVRTRALQLGLGASALDQLVATSYFEEAAPVREEVVGRLARARDTWLAELADRLPEWRVRPPDGGLALWVELPRRASSELALAASTRHLLLTPGPRFSADRTQTNRLRLPLTLPPDVIGEAVARLAAAWDDVVSGVRVAVGRDAVAL